MNQILQRQQKESLNILSKENLQTILVISKAVEINKEYRKRNWRDNYKWWVEDNWTSRGKKLSIDETSNRPYLDRIYRKNDDPIIVFKKSAQIGLTERMISEAAWLVDQFNYNALYFMPVAGNLSSLVQERLDDPINNSPYLSEVVGRVKGSKTQKQSDSVAVKRFSRGYLHFKGTKNPTQMISTPGDIIFVDELDRVDQCNLGYLDKRLENSALKWERWASTPTIPNFGIDLKYKETNQQEWNIQCPHCNKWQHLTFWDNVRWDTDNKQIKNERIICAKCGKTLIPWQCKGEWVAKCPEKEITGYFVHQLYSPTVSLKKLIKSSLSTVEEEIVQFYNQNLGLAYEPKGAKLSEQDFENCKRDYLLRDKFEGKCFIGFDVGKIIHYVIRTNKRLVDTGTLDHFFIRDGEGSAEELIKRYKPAQFAIDAMPESRNSVELCQMFPNKGLYVYYTDVKPAKEEYEEREGVLRWIEIDGDQCNANRTVTMDYTLNDIRKELIEIPKDIDNVSDFKDHHKNLIRVTTKDKFNNAVSSYEQVGPDHYAHANNYATIAMAAYDDNPVFVSI